MDFIYTLDILSDKIPLIFQREIYASACLLGGFTYLILKQTQMDEDIIFIISASVIVSVRLIAVKYHLELPKIKDDLFTKH